MDEVIGIALGVVVTLTGRLVVSVLTFRHWRGESLDGQEGESTALPVPFHSYGTDIAWSQLPASYSSE
ncbi:hypothetical protein [Diaphorobacter nitroreducens]|uniref:hypothetical protein n=1 Tax=Diaphorobacter nitroreducens TaxID=164759 RepID=UPI00289A4469|nr:hypothetical protein [Diaphorobacter nitroreducens]